MNREIKFRAWQKHHKYMFTPDYIDFVNNDVIIGENDGDNRYENIPLMQYTGLKDKNGKEIYEGDVIKSGIQSYLFGYNAVIVFNDKVSSGDNSCNYVGFKAQLIGNNRNRVLTKISASKSEVIGNIYENSYLLK